MILHLEIPDELAKSGWLRDIADEGAEACWCSADTDGVGPASALMYAVSDILNDRIPESQQQAHLNEKLAEAVED